MSISNECQQWVSAMQNYNKVCIVFHLWVTGHIRMIFKSEKYCRYLPTSLNLFKRLFYIMLLSNYIIKLQIIFQLMKLLSTALIIFSLDVKRQKVTSAWHRASSFYLEAMFCYLISSNQIIFNSLLSDLTDHIICSYLCFM